MDSSAADPVACGRPYGIVRAADDGDDLAPLGQFLGQTRFTIDKDGAESVISGEGVARDGGVRFHEKDSVRGMDVRVWQITQESGGGFTAASTSAF